MSNQKDDPEAYDELMHSFDEIEFHRVRLRAFDHFHDQYCWCGPVLIDGETITTEETWLHRTKYESN